MPEDNIFPVPGQVLLTTTGSSYGVSHQLHCGQPLHADCPPRVWKRFVDDTFVVIEAEKKQGFLEHINKVDPHIHFTTDDARTDVSILFLDTIVMAQPDGSLLTSVYGKPTHSDQYLQWNSHHHLSAKFSVINTLKHRAKTVCSNEHLLKDEEDHLNEALKKMQVPRMGPN